MPKINPEFFDQTVKTVGVATREAKDIVTHWAETIPDDHSKFGVVVVASTQIATDMVKAVLDLDDAEMAERTLRQIDFILKPELDRLRDTVAKNREVAN